MTDSERTALAMLRSGSSWLEASVATDVTVDLLRTLWRIGQDHRLATERSTHQANAWMLPMQATIPNTKPAENNSITRS